MLNADAREFVFTSGFDSLNVSALLAKPSGNINGIVQIVHGMFEHKERYFDFMDYLAGEGFLTVIHDNRGHGKSICTPDDLGFMFRDGGRGFVEDISQLRKSIHEAYPDLPYFMIGQGIGSLGVRCMLKDSDEGINGAILLGTPCAGFFPAFYRAIRSVSASGVQSRTRSDKILDAMERTFDVGGQPRSWFTSKREVVKEMNEDPLCSFNSTINGYEGLMYLLHEANNKTGWNVTNPALPIRFISGRDDPCMLSESKFMKNLKLLDDVGYESVSHRLFDNMRHLVLFEKNEQNVYKDIAKSLYSWIDRMNETVPEPVQPAPDTEAESITDTAEKG